MTLTDEEIYAAAKEYFGGRGHGLIWEDEPSYAQAIDMPKDARWSQSDIRAEDTVKFARALESKLLAHLAQRPTSEPTGEMRWAGAQAAKEALQWKPYELDWQKAAATIYKAMLAASPTPAAVPDTARLHMVLDTFGQREDNMPLTDAERSLIAAFDDRGSYTKGMKLSVIDDAVRACGVKTVDGGQQ